MKNRRKKKMEGAGRKCKEETKKQIKEKWRIKDWKAI